MTITLAYGSTTLTLPVDLFWADENQWSPVEQSTERSITGALIVSSATRIKGRPITLQPLDDSTAWMDRALVDALRIPAAVPGQVMTLTLGGQTYSVIFRHQDGAALDATPVVFYNDVDNADFYRTTLRLMEV